MCFQFYGGERLTLGRSLDFAIYLGIKSVYVSFTRTLADKGRTAGGLHRPQCPQLHALGEPEPQSSRAWDWEAGGCVRVPLVLGRLGTLSFGRWPARGHGWPGTCPIVPQALHLPRRV